MRFLSPPTRAFLQRCLIGLLVWSVTGCYRLQFYHDTVPLRATPDGEIQHSSTAFAAVEIQTPTKLRPLCPSGASKLEFEQTWGDGLLHYLTLGFYSPQTIRVWCKRRPSEEKSHG